MAIHEIRHPLIRHKLGLLRRADISTKNFRELAQEVTMLLTYEATKDLPVCDHEIDGWNGKVTVDRIVGKNYGCTNFTCRYWHVRWFLKPDSKCQSIGSRFRT